MREAGARRYRDKLLFALAYAAIIGAVLFAHPFGQDPSAPQVAAVEAAR
jgi:hypothetical protein